MEIGIGLWTMRATAAFPAGFPELYARLPEHARLAEGLGYHSLWLAEHHCWYDGWCPAPLTAAGAVLAATSRLRVGTGIHLLPLQESEPVERELRSLQRLSGGRLEHGVGLGYRAVEYDAYGVALNRRGRRMDAALDRLTDPGTWGEVPPAPIWIGGFSEAALRRAGSRGLGVLLPSTLRPQQLERAIALMRAAALEAGREPGAVGVLKSAFVANSDSERARCVDRHVAVSREYTGSWYPLDGRPGFESSDRVDAQVARAIATAAIGTADEVREHLRALEGVGADLVVLNVLGDAPSAGTSAAIERLAEAVMPALSTVAL
jgi:alkanesulfonate monooxygenase SsuD/methylene tetrahydromethanopterin reductase-like flavin-dependent oxidoreductase (luciferase family)